MTMFMLKIYCRWLIYSCFTVLATQVTCEEFSECYDDVNICLWTNGSQLSQSAAQTACQRQNSFLPRITNSIIQSKLAEFRNASDNLLYGRGFWIDVRAVGINNWHWIDDSPLADGGHVDDQTNDMWLRFAVIAYKNNRKQFVYSARRWNYYLVLSYICQLQTGASCADGDLSINSKCYRKYDRQLSWFNASNDCLSRGGSLAVFTDIENPSDNSQLTDWLNATGTDKIYWIGLIRPWWNTTGEDGRAVDVQYSNWEIGHPSPRESCVIVTQTNYWNTWNCDKPQKYVCQNYTGRTTPITTTTTAAPMNSPSRTDDSTPASSRSTASSTSEPGGGDNQSLIIGVAVGATVGVLIIIAIIIIVVLLLKKKRRTTSRPNGEVRANTNEPAYDEVRDPPHLTYATIESVRKDGKTSTPVVNPEQPVIYSDLASLSNSRDINV